MTYNSTIRHHAIAVMFALAAVFSLPATAMAAGIELVTEAFREVEVALPGGKKEKRMEAVVSAAPGQEVIYVTTYRNTSDKPAEKVVVRNPVPQGMVFRAGSAQGAGARIDVSVDGGKEYGVLAMLSVKDGNGKLRAARPEDVTHVRWTLATPVKPGGEGKVSYRAALK